MSRKPEIIKTFTRIVDGKPYEVKLIAPRPIAPKPEPMQTRPSESAWQRYTRREHARMAL